LLGEKTDREVNVSVAPTAVFPVVSKEKTQPDATDCLGLSAGFTVRLFQLLPGCLGEVGKPSEEAYGSVLITIRLPGQSQTIPVIWLLMPPGLRKIIASWSTGIMTGRKSSGGGTPSAKTALRSPKT